ncbi:hypothetical protein BH24ACT16_BH24ACT16_17000 [soil metagenome]
MEALAIGAMAGFVALRGGRSERSRRWIPITIALCVTVLTSALALATLLYVGSAVVQELWFGPEPSVPEDRN